MKNELVFWVSKDADGTTDGWNGKPYWMDNGEWYRKLETYQPIFTDLIELFQLDEQIEPGEAAEIRLTFEVLRKEKGND